MVILTFSLRMLISTSPFDWWLCGISDSSAITLKSYDVSYMADSTGNHPKPLTPPNLLNENTQLLFFSSFESVGLQSKQAGAAHQLVTIVTAIVAKLQLKFKTDTPHFIEGFTRWAVLGSWLFRQNCEYKQEHFLFTYMDLTGLCQRAPVLFKAAPPAKQLIRNETTGTS